MYVYVCFIVVCVCVCVIVVCVYVSVCVSLLVGCFVLVWSGLGFLSWKRGEGEAWGEEGTRQKDIEYSLTVRKKDQEISFSQFVDTCESFCLTPSDHNLCM